jgi:hypothetical protein
MYLLYIYGTTEFQVDIINVLFNFVSKKQILQSN